MPNTSISAGLNVGNLTGPGADGCAGAALAADLYDSYSTLGATNWWEVGYDVVDAFNWAAFDSQLHWFDRPGGGPIVKLIGDEIKAAGTLCADLFVYQSRLDLGGSTAAAEQDLKNGVRQWWKDSVKAFAKAIVEGGWNWIKDKALRSLRSEKVRQRIFKFLKADTLPSKAANWIISKGEEAGEKFIVNGITNVAKRIFR